MKRTGHLFERAVSFGNLNRAFKKAYQGSRKSVQACEFNFHLETNLIELSEMLADGSYRPDKYRYFTIHDPKERMISVAPFRDRVVHHAVVGVMEPAFEKSFMYDSYATRKNKGTHRALLRAQAFLGKNRYYLKSDISKYFQSIDHETLLSLIGRKIKDRKLMDLIRLIVHNNDVSQGVYDGRGLPVGNLTSQFFANVYLDPFDHFIKEEKRIKHYIRYMDDILFFSNSKDELKELLGEIRIWLAGRLNLVLKPSATQINTRNHGLSYLGFRIYPSLIRIRRENYTRIVKRLKLKQNQLKKGVITEDEYIAGVRSAFVHTAFADSHSLRTNDLVLRAGAL